MQKWALLLLLISLLAGCSKPATTDAYESAEDSAAAEEPHISSLQASEEASKSTTSSSANLAPPVVITAGRAHNAESKTALLEDKFSKICNILKNCGSLTTASLLDEKGFSLQTNPTATDTLSFEHHIQFEDESVIASSDDTSGAVRLTSGKKTKLIYGITSTLTSNTKNTKKYATSPDLSKEIQSKSSNLSVEFKCNVCNGEDNFQDIKNISYDDSERKTNEVVFNFTPIKPGLNFTQPDRHGITLTILRNGIPYREVYICVDIDDLPSACSGTQDSDGQPANGSGELDVNSQSATSGTPPPQPAQKPAIVALKGSLLQNSASAAPDLDIYISTGASQALPAPDNDQYIYAKLVIENDTLVQQLKQLLRQKNQSNIANKIKSGSILDLSYSPSINSITSWQDFNRLSLDNSERLICATSHDSVVLEIEKDVADCQAFKGRGIGAYLLAIGRSYYTSLFSGDADQVIQALTRISQAQVNAGLPALKVRIRSDDHRIPFQIVTSCASDASDSDCTNQMFGLVFDLAEYANTGTSRGTGEAKSLTDDPLIALYSGNSTPEDQAVSQTANTHFQAITRLIYSIKTTPQIIEINHAQDFTNRLDNDHNSISMIWYFGHGSSKLSPKITNIDDPNAALSSGSTLAPATILTIDDFSNARIYFSHAGDDDTDAISARYIYSESDVTSGPFFAAHPLVVLLACETGAPPADDIGLNMTKAFLKTGARGVIAAEAPVDSQKTDEFGQLLMSNILSGKYTDPGAALLATRRALYVNSKNTDYLPLLFYYTGYFGSTFVERH